MQAAASRLHDRVHRRIGHESPGVVPGASARGAVTSRRPSSASGLMSAAMLAPADLVPAQPNQRRFLALDRKQIALHLGFALLARFMRQRGLVIGLAVDLGDRARVISASLCSHATSPTHIDRFVERQ